MSYSRNDLEAAANLRLISAKHGLSVFKDDESIREGELWLNRLQDEVDACGAFVVLIGRDGVAALDRRRDAGGLEPLFRSPRRREAPADFSDSA